VLLSTGRARLTVGLSVPRLGLSRLWLGLSVPRLGIGIRRARLSVSLGQAQLGLGSRGHVWVMRTDLCAGIPRDVLAAAGARAQVVGKWPRAPVVRGG
jgi:hypothetical protein